MVVVVGSGKLVRELLDSLRDRCSNEVIAWSDLAKSAGSSVVIHAGSGRELDEVISYCQKTGSTLVELATGSDLANRQLNFPVVICPNTNILMLKFMAMLAKNGAHFKNYKIKVAESHQADKTSTPGTAVSLAHSLGVERHEIVSVRSPQEQMDNLNIPAEYLSRHACHRIVIEDQLSSVILETRVFGPAPYAEGLARIISAIGLNRLENRQYDIIEFVELGWI